MQKLLAQIVVYLGDKIIDVVTKLVQQWLREKRIEREVRDAMANKKPADRANSLGNEL